MWRDILFGVSAVLFLLSEFSILFRETAAVPLRLARVALDERLPWKKVTVCGEQFIFHSGENREEHSAEFTAKYLLAPGRRVLVGRSRTCAIQPVSQYPGDVQDREYQQISRRHARLCYDKKNACFFLEDQNSTNGLEWMPEEEFETIPGTRHHGKRVFLDRDIRVWFANLSLVFCPSNMTMPPYDYWPPKGGITLCAVICAQIAGLAAYTLYYPGTFAAFSFSDMIVLCLPGIIAVALVLACSQKDREIPLPAAWFFFAFPLWIPYVFRGADPLAEAKSLSDVFLSVGLIPLYLIASDRKQDIPGYLVAVVVLVLLGLFLMGKNNILDNAVTVVYLILCCYKSGRDKIKDIPT